MEVLPESTCIRDTTEKSNDKNQNKQQPQYWKKAFHLADFPVISEAISGLDIGKLIVSLERTILDHDG